MIFNMGFVDIIKLITSDMSLAVAAMLISGVVFVNGWTDAPGAITASVSTGKTGITLFIFII